MQVKGQSRAHALLETVRKLLEMGEEEEEEEELQLQQEQIAEGASFAQQVLVSGTPTIEEPVVIVAAPLHRRRGMQRPAVPGGPCANCGINESPQWRRPSGKKIVLCNACGIYYSRHHTLPKRKKQNIALVPALASGPQAAAASAQGIQCNPASMDIVSNDSQGDEEAITATGPVHHMSLLQQVACAAASRPSYTRRPSSNSDASQTDAINMSQSVRSSPSRSSQDDFMHEDLPAPAAAPAPATKAEDSTSLLSHPSTQLPVLVPSVPSRKRSLHAGSLSASNSTPTASTNDPAFATAPPPAPAATAPATAPPSLFPAHPWGLPHHLVLLQQLHLQQQHQLHLRLMHQQQQEQLHKKQALGAHPSHDLLRIMASMQPHPQLLAAQQPDALPHMQHALLLQHMQQQQQQLLHNPLSSLTHLSSMCSPGLTGLMQQHHGLASGASMGAAGHGLLPRQQQQPQPQRPHVAHMHAATSRPQSQEDPSSSHGSSSSHAGLLPQGLLQSQQQQQLRWPAPVLAPHPAVTEHCSSYTQLQGAGAPAPAPASASGACSEGELDRRGVAASMPHRLSLCPSHSLPLPQLDEQDARVQLVEPAAKRQQRHESDPCMGLEEGEASNALKVIPTYVCRGPRSVSFDATSSAAHLQQQQQQQQAAATTHGLGTAPTLTVTMYRPASCALSDC